MQNNSSVKILVVGAGGVGAYFSGRLAQIGARVAVVCRSDYAAVKKHGFTISSIAGDFNFNPHQTLRSVEYYHDTPDYIIVAVKALPNINPAALIAPAVTPATTLVLLQNGIGVEKSLHQAYPDNELISGIAYIGVFREGEGHICHQGGGRLKLGCFPHGISDKLQHLGAMFEQAGVECEITADIVRKRWEKLLWNVPFNTISVLAGGLDTKEIMSDSHLPVLAEKLMREVIAIADADGVKLDSELVEWNLNYTRNFPPYKTSMLLDYEHHRPLEVEAIIGNLLRLAQKHQLQVPHIETIFAQLNAANQHQSIQIYHKNSKGKQL